MGTVKKYSRFYLISQNMAVLKYPVISILFVCMAIYSFLHFSIMRVKDKIPTDNNFPNN